LDITVHTAYEEYPMSPMDHCDSYVNSDAQLADSDKPHKINFDDNLEGREEKRMGVPVGAVV
jgi:hypothetical protein